MPRILVVDDDDAVRALLRLVFTRQGHEVLEAADGRDALRVYEENRPDLVITDLVMPNKEGLETILELRRKYPEIKIIAMSGGGRAQGTDYLKMAKAMGANHTLSKPLSVDKLPGIVNSILNPTAPS